MAISYGPRVGRMVSAACPFCLTQGRNPGAVDVAQQQARACGEHDALLEQTGQPPGCTDEETRDAALSARRRIA